MHVRVRIFWASRMLPVAGLSFPVIETRPTARSMKNPLLRSISPHGIAVSCASRSSHTSRCGPRREYLEDVGAQLAGVQDPTIH